MALMLSLVTLHNYSSRSLHLQLIQAKSKWLLKQTAARHSHSELLNSGSQTVA